MTTRVYKVFAADETKAARLGVAKDRKSKARGDYRGRTVTLLKKNAKGPLHLWRVALT